MIVNKRSGENVYEPTLLVAPGETLDEVLGERGITQAEFAKRVGKHPKTINEIIKGVAVITPETSLEFEQVLGIPAHFWNNLEARYQELKTRKEIEDTQASFVSEAEKYPYSEMVKLGWVSPASNIKEKVPHLLSFFAVTDFKNIIEKGAFRISSKHTYSMPAIMTWLRKGSIDSLSIETQEYNQEKLIASLSALKLLTKESDPNKMMREIKKILADCGVAFVLTQSLKNAPINGVTRWLNPNKVLLQLSLRYKYADIFWFSLFHEIGHILYDNKKDFNVDLVNSPVELEKEKRADRFACNELVPEEDYAKFTTYLKQNTLDSSSIYRVILRFASQVNIHPGIISGRLQHDKILSMNMNRLRSKLDWA